MAVFGWNVGIHLAGSCGAGSDVSEFFFVGEWNGLLDGLFGEEIDKICVTVGTVGTAFDVFVFAYWAPGHGWGLLSCMVWGYFNMRKRNLQIGGMVQREEGVEKYGLRIGD